MDEGRRPPCFSQFLEFRSRQEGSRAPAEQRGKITLCHLCIEIVPSTRRGSLAWQENPKGKTPRFNTLPSASSHSRSHSLRHQTPVSLIPPVTTTPKCWYYRLASVPHTPKQTAFFSQSSIVASPNRDGRYYNSHHIHPKRNAISSPLRLIFYSGRPSPAPFPSRVYYYPHVGLGGRGNHNAKQAKEKKETGYGK